MTNNATQKILDEYSILSSADVGFEFEFLCDYSEKIIIKELSKLFNTNVKLAYKNSKISKKEFSYVSKSSENHESEFKLTHDFSGGNSLLELITPPLQYSEARIVLAKMLEWIKQNAKTNDKSSLHINISFDKKRTPNNQKIDITKLDKLKFVLSFDESYVFNRFPDRENNVYSRGINQIFPTNLFFFNNDITSISPNNFTVPTDKYYGINFSKLQYGYLEFRYIGGQGYQRKVKEIFELFNYYILSLYYCLINPNYTFSDLNQINNRLQQHKLAIGAFTNHIIFMNAYPNINLYVDLKNHEENIKTYFVQFKEQLFDLIHINGLTSADINYDSEIGKCQVKNGIFNNGYYLKNYEFIECKIKNASIENCLFLRCKIKNCNILNSWFTYDNEIKDSKVSISQIDNADNNFNNCYIDNENNLIKGNYINSIIRSGNLSLVDFSADNITKIININV